MRVPVDAIRTLKSVFKDSKELARVARAAGIQVSDELAAQMWRGDFRHAGLIETEGFFLLLGYELKVVKAHG